MPEQLSGRRVLITGASSGIGFAAAEAFAREGADLALVARSEPGLEAAADAARALGARVYVVPADLGTREECERAGGGNHGRPSLWAAVRLGRRALRV